MNPILFSACVECNGFRGSEATASGDRYRSGQQEEQQGEFSGFREKSHSTQGIQLRECGVLPPSLSLCLQREISNIIHLSKSTKEPSEQHTRNLGLLSHEGVAILAKDARSCYRHPPPPAAGLSARLGCSTRFWVSSLNLSGLKTKEVSSYRIDHTESFLEPLPTSLPTRQVSLCSCGCFCLKDRWGAPEF